MIVAPHASTALDRARQWVGLPIRPGICLGWLTREIFGVVPSWDVNDYWAKALDVTPAADLVEIRAGDVLAWIGEPHGHIAIASTPTTCIGTDVVRRGRVDEHLIVDVEAAFPQLQFAGIIHRDGILGAHLGTA